MLLDNESISLGHEHLRLILFPPPTHTHKYIQVTQKVLSYTKILDSMYTRHFCLSLTCMILNLKSELVFLVL